MSTRRSGAKELKSPMADWMVRLVSVAKTLTQLCGWPPVGQGCSFKYRSSNAVPRRCCCLKPHSVSCPESARSLEWVGACFFSCQTGTPGLPASSESAASVPCSVSAVTWAFWLSTCRAVTPHWAMLWVLVSSANSRTHSSACITDRSPWRVNTKDRSNVATPPRGALYPGPAGDTSRCPQYPMKWSVARWNAEGVLSAVFCPPMSSVCSATVVALGGAERPRNWWRDTRALPSPYLNKATRLRLHGLNRSLDTRATYGRFEVSRITEIPS
mmetsp:Transcript_103186/g.236425  ORF Transcript_103186/g.236425 Transcript_103186/m.236425 type:complete len:271 (+) Transcript_103186:732-1544(+)